jgi:hypothetical protein
MHAQNEPEMASIASEIDALRHQTVAQLQIRYLEVFGEPSRSNHKQFLIRRIATPAAPGSRRDARLPRPGTVLTRRFREQTFTVQVLEKGFHYEGSVYRSLSAVARQISGTQWNGFPFFGCML